MLIEYRGKNEIVDGTAIGRDSSNKGYHRQVRFIDTKQ